MNYNSMVNLLVVVPLDNDHRSYSSELLHDGESSQVTRSS
jgi:hypothetical protein